MKCLDLFTGIGGMGRLLPVDTIMYCEKDPYCRKVLEKRMCDGDLHNAPIHEDIFDLDPPDHDILIGGFPCQDISRIGQRRGFQGERSSLYFQILRIVKMKHPKYIFLENVRHILNMPKVWKPVVTTLSEEGYDMKWMIVAANNCKALHTRQRWFLLAKYTGKPTTPTLTQDKMDPFGCIEHGIYQKQEDPKFYQHKRKPFLLKALPNVPSKSTIYEGTVVRERWATPRAIGGFRAVRNLTHRSIRDLTSQLRFATCTKEKHMCANLMWVEQLMGLPGNWTHPEKSIEPFEGFEPERYKRMKPDNAQEDYRKRWKTLGNMCVSQCALKAFHYLF